MKEELQTQSRANPRNLSALAYAQGFTHWAYVDRSLDPQIMMLDGFFAGVFGYPGGMQNGDLVTLVANGSTRTLSVWLFGIGPRGVVGLAP